MMEIGNLFAFGFLHTGQQPDPAGPAFLPGHKYRVVTLGAPFHADQRALGFCKTGGWQGQRACRKGGVVQRVQHNYVANICQQCIDVFFRSSAVEVILQDEQGIQCAGGGAFTQLCKARCSRPTQHGLTQAVGLGYGQCQHGSIVCLAQSAGDLRRGLHHCGTATARTGYNKWALGIL